MELFVCRAVCRQSKHSEHNVRGQRSEEEPIKPQSLVSCCRNMKSLGVLTVLGLVLVYSQVQGLPTQQETKGCGTVLRPEELHKVSGSWVLVFVTYDPGQSFFRFFPAMLSSHFDIKVQPDNRTVSIQEDILHFSGCKSMTYNLTLPESGAGVQQMHMHVTEMFRNGELVSTYERATLSFISFSQNTFRLLYKNNNRDEKMLLTYKREGHHEGDLQKELLEHRVKAECLGLSRETFKDWLGLSRETFKEELSVREIILKEMLDLSGKTFKEWHYSSNICDGICHKRTTLGPEQLHQMTGDWVTMFLTRTNNNNLTSPTKRKFPPMTSSQLKIQVSADNQTANVHVNGMFGGMCVSDHFNAAVPQSGSGVQQLHMLQTEKFVDGKLVKAHDEIKLQLLHISPNTMNLLYTTTNFERLLTIYRRRGHHEEDLDSELVEHRVKARCVALSGGYVGEWQYDGKSDFCYRSSAPDTVQS